LAPDFVDGSAAAAVISEVLWRELFAQSPAAIGAPITVNGRPFVVVGVARPGPPTTFWGASVDLWIPLSQGDVFFSPTWRTAIGARSLTVFALPVAPPAVVTEQLRRTAGDLAEDHPVPWRQQSLQLSPATALLGSQRASASLLSRVLVGLAILILVAASANLGATMLAGAAAGRRALAIHAAIGAGPAVGPRRVLIEGALIGAGAAVLAVLLYAAARVRLTEIALLPTLSFRVELPSATMLLWLIAPAGLAAGLLMAAGPATWLARQSVGAHLLAGARSAGDRGIARTRRLLVGAQVALCLVLLIGASLFTRSLDRLTRADLGFDRDGLLAFDFDIEPADAGQRLPDAVAADALRRVRAMPGVTAAAMASRAPVDASTPVTRVSNPRDPGATGIDVTFTTVSAGYFETVGVPVVVGRVFRDDEREGVAIVNETLARKLWPEGGALDRTITLDASANALRIVGVARDAKYQSISETARPHVYLAASPRFGQALLVRTADDPRRALADVQRVLDGLGVAGFFPRTADDHLAIQWLPTRAVSAVARWLGALALAFCAAGLYGLVAWFAELRRSEMAVRLALGATRVDIERLVIGHALAIAGPGLVAGLVLAAVAAPAARALLYGIGPPDLVAPAAGIAVLLVVVVAASWKPARAAARTDPAVALRA
jgi:predicted permease